MTPAALVEQLFNGLQFGLMLFLMAVGVTLVFGIMRVVNLAHGATVHARRLLPDGRADR
jgi:branched-chain amino acid transport system permease protein